MKRRSYLFFFKKKWHVSLACDYSMGPHVIMFSFYMFSLNYHMCINCVYLEHDTWHVRFNSKHDKWLGLETYIFFKGWKFKFSKIMINYGQWFILQDLGSYELIWDTVAKRPWWKVRVADLKVIQKVTEKMTFCCRGASEDSPSLHVHHSSFVHSTLTVLKPTNQGLLLLQVITLEENPPFRKL